MKGDDACISRLTDRCNRGYQLVLWSPPNVTNSDKIWILQFSFYVNLVYVDEDYGRIG